MGTTTSRRPAVSAKSSWYLRCHRKKHECLKSGGAIEKLNPEKPALEGGHRRQAPPPCQRQQLLVVPCAAGGKGLRTLWRRICSVRSRQHRCRAEARQAAHCWGAVHEGGNVGADDHVQARSTSILDHLEVSEQPETMFQNALPCALDEGGKSAPTLIKTLRFSIS